MRRLALRLFTFCSVVSLLLCVAVCVLWARSTTDTLIYDESLGCEWALRSSGGAFVLTWRDSPSVMNARGWHGDIDERYLTPRPGVGGFDYNRSPPAGSPAPFGSVWASHGSAKVPHWAVALVTVWLPVIRLRSWAVARHRTSRALCPRCAYDLRASPGRCPECGSAAARP